MVYLVTLVSSSQCVVSNASTLVDNEVERISKDMALRFCNGVPMML
jgi:hypothetical protein